MLIIETPIFTRLIEQYLKDEDYRMLQLSLAAVPDTGDLIRGSGGLRKLRWKSTGKGKRGGVRVIYYWIKAPGIILMLYIYPKNRQSDLTEEQIKILRRVVEEEWP